MAPGYAEKLKVMIKHSFFDWLDDHENADKWYGKESFIASESRIHWIKDAHQKLLDNKWDSYRYCLFEKTGCLVTTGVSYSNLIQQ